MSKGIRRSEGIRLKSKLFSGMILLVLLLLSDHYAFGQDASGRVVSGNVKDMDGNPLAGVTVRVKSTSIGTTTGDNGNYSIKVPEANTVLTYSSVGYVTQEEYIEGRSTIDIKLERQNNALAEAVVIGYGTQSKRDVTGSVATVDLKQIKDVPVASVTEALQGQIPGLHITGGSQRPGTLASLDIRQQFNWGKDGGNRAPLVVIDDVLQVDPATGLPSLERFNQLDMSEIESITVLRDASAAIYGTRASQGVIVVKTKRGKAGAPRLTYNGKFERMDAVSHGKVMNARQYGAYSNSFNRSLGRSDDYQYSEAELKKMEDLDYDWLAHDWNAAFTMQHSLDVSGGSDKATYFMGASYYTQGANLGSQDFNRWTYRGGTNIKLLSGLDLGATIAAANTNVEESFSKIAVRDGFGNGSEQNDYSMLLHMPKYIPWVYNINGVDRYIAPPLGSNRAGSIKGNRALSNWNYYALLNNGSKTTKKNFNYNVNFSLNYELPWVKGLSFKLNYGRSQVAKNTEQIMLPQMLYQATSIAAAGHHLFSETEADDWDSKLNDANSRVTYDNVTSLSEQSNFFINYQNSFGGHNISAMVSVEKSTNSLEDRYQIYDKPTAGIYNGTSVSAGTLNASNTITHKYENGTLSYLGRLSYNFRHKYLFQFVFRTDASTTFAPENYWGFFPGVSAGWVISDEHFFKDNISWMDLLKIRTSWGITGNNNIKAWRWLQLYSAATDKGFGFGENGGLFVPGLTPEVSPNRDVHWDRTLQRNFGLDLAFFDNRLTVTFDQYYNSTTDMLTDMSGALNTPISVGGAFAEQNYADVDAWGTELSVNWHDQVGDFSYSIGMNTAFDNYKIKKYYDVPFDYPSENTERKKQGTYGIQPIYGYKTWKQTSGGDGILRTDADIDNYWNYLTQNAEKSGVEGAAPNFLGITDKSGLKKGMLVYQDIAGDLDPENKTIAGPNGRIMEKEDFAKLIRSNRTYGISTNINLGWKNFSLTAQLSTSWGGARYLDYIKQGTSSSNAMWSQPIYLTDMYDEVDNPDGKYPNIAYYDNFGGANSDFFLLPTFRMFVRTLSIGYTLPEDIVSKARLSSVRFYLSGHNLWDFYNPYPDHFRNMYDAADVGYPTLRTWALGVSIGF